MIVLRQKSFAEGEEKQGMSTGKKIALGLGATALAAGATFAGARRGMLGVNAQKATNTWFAKGGGRLMNSSNKTLQNLGNRMVDSGVAGVGSAAKKQAVSEFASKNNLSSMRDIVKAGGNKVGNEAAKKAEVGLLSNLIHQK